MVEKSQEFALFEAPKNEIIPREVECHSNSIRIGSTSHLLRKKR